MGINEHLRCRKIQCFVNSHNALASDLGERGNFDSATRKAAGKNATFKMDSCNVTPLAVYSLI